MPPNLTPNLTHVALYDDDLTDGAVSDASAIVHAHHVVHPRNIAVESGPILDGDRAIGYEFTVDISDRGNAAVELYEALTRTADEHHFEFTLGAADGTSTMSYTAGDRAHFLQQQALRGLPA